MGTLKVKNPVYPVLSVISAVVILVVGLVTAKTAASTFFAASPIPTGARSIPSSPRL